MISADEIKKNVHEWLDKVVIGLKLCPFAKRPFLEEKVRIEPFFGDKADALIEKLQAELVLIDDPKNRQVETTLLVIAEQLQDFYEYNQFLNEVDRLLAEEGWNGKYQIATFHPAYQFAGTASTDAENLTNRSPYPILQILSEQSLSEQLENYLHPETIPQKNIQTMQSLSETQRKSYFPYLYKT